MKNALLFIVILNFSFEKTEDQELYYAELPEVIVTESYSDTVMLLARLIFSEGSRCTSDYLAIAEVVINRSEIKKLSISEIIFRKGQFDGVRSKKWYRITKDDFCKNSKEAFQWKTARLMAFKALSGSNTIPDNIYYFHNKKIATDTRHVERLKKKEWKIIGSHTFCYK